MSKQRKDNSFSNTVLEMIKTFQEGDAPLSSKALAKMVRQLDHLREQQAAQEIKEREERERKEAHIRDIFEMNLPLDWENIFDGDPRAQGVRADSIPDGLILSLANLGRVDIEYISSITGADCKTVICTLRGSIYQNPETWEECFWRGWETAEEYLSGNLIRKWNAASKANEAFPGYFSENLRAIEKVLPPAVAAKNIYITLGSPWVPPYIIDQFIVEEIGHSRAPYRVCANESELQTKHDEITGTWEIPHKNRYGNSVTVNSTYGTPCLNALHILERTLNMRSVCVTREVFTKSLTASTKRVIDQSETLLALEKQQKLILAFQKWVWKDKQRKEALQEIYETRFGCMRRRIFDGSFLTFPTMSREVSLYPYQKNAVARILFTPNTLLAHDVGSGKTYVMIAAGMELLRMGLSKKNLYVVPNNLVGQWKSIFLEMYPQANLLCVEPRNFTPAKREGVLRAIRDTAFDGIIIAYSCFERIPLSREYYQEQLREEQETVASVISEKSKATSKLAKKQDTIAKALAKLAVAIGNAYSGISFDELGVTRLFVDEAHNYKNVPIETKTDKVLGIHADGSEKCRDMMDKVRWVQKQNNGGGVVFATGTPITNSLTDIFVIQQYLQSGELAMLDLQHFDSWVGMFAEKSTGFEIDVDTSSYRMATRFSKFHNLTELTTLLASFADFHRVDASAGIPETDGYRDALVSRTDELSDYLEDISRRADEVRSGNVKRRDDNMLRITTDGRKAALDMRLVDPTAPFTYQSKVARCAENVADIYFETMADASTQLVFCDTSTPKAGFNVYDELKRLLVNNGIPADTVAYVHDAETEKQRNALFRKVRDGVVRVLIGSTFKLGLGVNVQDRLIALHHLDVPWRPADMVQREGRILRQGNRNKKVRIFRYITEGSFDAYSWQLLESKQHIISSLLSGSLTERDSDDIDDTVLGYAEVKALAIGNPLIKERVETANELTRYITLQKKTAEARERMEQELIELPSIIARQEACIQNCEEDARTYAAWVAENPPPESVGDRKTEAESRKVLRESLRTALAEHILEPGEKVFGSYCGFEILLPTNMTKERPFVWLRGAGKYYLELGESDTGFLIRIDNFLQNLSEHLKKLNDGLARLLEKQSRIREELDKNESYISKIEKCRKKLAKLDKELGVTNE